MSCPTKRNGGSVLFLKHHQPQSFGVSRQTHMSSIKNLKVRKRGIQVGLEENDIGVFATAHMLGDNQLYLAPLPRLIMM
jgi:hypothetical protein